MICSSRISVLILLAGFTTPGAAQFCKWVDDEGVVHYAESCPENINGSTVHSPPPPSAEEVEAAVQRAEALRSARLARSEAERQVAEDAAESAPEPVPPTSCEEAFRSREILELQLPVYYDDQSVLYYRDSLHHHWYEGPRIYLDDEGRSWEARNNEQLIESQCAGIEPSRPEYVVRFRDRPTLEETVDMLSRPDRREAPPLRELCPYADDVAREVQENLTGVPSDDMRFLENLIGRFCR